MKKIAIPQTELLMHLSYIMPAFLLLSKAESILRQRLKGEKAT